MLWLRRDISCGDAYQSMGKKPFKINQSMLSIFDPPP